MAKKKNYTPEGVAFTLNKKRDVYVHLAGKTVTIKTGSDASGDLGIKARGKIDFLVNHAGFIKQFN